MAVGDQCVDPNCGDGQYFSHYKNTCRCEDGGQYVDADGVC